MINPTSNNVKGFLSFSVINGRDTIISNLNKLGYPTSFNITNKELVEKMYSIYSDKGSDEISKIIEGITIDKSKYTQQDLREIKSTLTGESVQQISTNKTFLETLQEIWAGTSSTTGDSSSTTTKPIINPIAAVVITVIGIVVVLIIAFRK